jgi:hypothetical protein
LTRKRPEIADKIPQLIELVNQAVPDCLVENYEWLIESLVLPDVDDRHVLAAAVVGHADAIVTMNLKDFPKKVLAKYNLEAQHPDDFIMNQLELRELDALVALKMMRERMRKPPRSAAELIDIIERNQLPQTAQYLRVRVGLI